VNRVVLCKSCVGVSTVLQRGSGDWRQWVCSAHRLTDELKQRQHGLGGEADTLRLVEPEELHAGQASTSTGFRTPWASNDCGPWDRHNSGTRSSYAEYCRKFCKRAGELQNWESYNSLPRSKGPIL
jgi:hypothetical protein